MAKRNCTHLRLVLPEPRASVPVFLAVCRRALWLHALFLEFTHAHFFFVEQIMFAPFALHVRFHFVFHLVHRFICAPS